MGNWQTTALFGLIGIVALTVVFGAAVYIRRFFVSLGHQRQVRRVRDRWRAQGVSKGQLNLMQALGLGQPVYGYHGHWLACGEVVATDQEAHELLDGEFVLLVGGHHDLLALLPSGHAFLHDNGLEASKAPRVSAFHDYSYSAK